MNAHLILDDQEDSEASNNDNDSLQSLHVVPHFIDYDLSEQVRVNGGVLPAADQPNDHNQQGMNIHDLLSQSSGTGSLEEFMNQFLYPEHNNEHQEDHNSLPQEICCAKPNSDSPIPPSSSSGENPMLAPFSNPYNALASNDQDTSKKQRTDDYPKRNTSSKISANKSIPTKEERTVFMSMTLFQSFIEPWASLLDVYGDGNCLHYAAIIALNCICNESVLPSHGWINILRNNLRDVTSFRRNLRDTFVDNISSFGSPDPAVRRVHNNNGERLTPYESYDDMMIGPTSIAAQLYSDDNDYSNGCGDDAWGDVYSQLPIIAYAHSSTVVCYMVGARVDRDPMNLLKNITTVIAEFSDGRVTLCVRYGQWEQPPSSQHPIITLCHVGNHFMYLHPHDSTIALPLDIGTTFKPNPLPQHQQQNEHSTLVRQGQRSNGSDRGGELSRRKKNYLTSQRHRIRPLTTDESNIVSQALYDEGLLTEILMSFCGNCVTRNSIRTCRPGNWVIDEVITFYLKCLSEQDRIMSISQPKRKRSHFFNSFFIQNLLDVKNNDPKLCGKYNYKKARRWSKKVPGEDIFNMNFIFVPINKDNLHWTCACIFMEQNVIEYFDSMGESGMKYLNALLQYVRDEWRSKTGLLLNTEEWQLIDRANDIPQQHNGCDCGVFTCTYAYSILWDSRPMFSQSDIPLFRKHMVLSIMTNTLSIMLQEESSPDSNQDDDDGFSQDDDSSQSASSSSSDGWILNYDVGWKRSQPKKMSPANGSNRHDNDIVQANESFQPHIPSDTNNVYGNAYDADAMCSGTKSCSDDQSITKPSALKLNQLADTVGGKASLSSYKHFVDKETTVGDTFIRYEDFKEKTVSVTVPSLSVSGKVVAAHDGNDLTHALFAENFKKGRGPWFVDLISSAEDFPSHISLRCQKDGIVSLNPGKGGKRANHPFIVYFSGWCSGRIGRTKKTNNNSNNFGCTTEWVGGFDRVNLERLSRNPEDAVIEVKIIISGQCIHNRNARMGQLRGPARQRCVEKVRSSPKHPSEHALSNLLKMDRLKFLNNNHTGEATSPGVMYNVKREAHIMNRKDKGILQGHTEDIANIYRVEKTTCDKDLNSRRLNGDKSEVLPGVVRFIQLSPDVDIWLHSRGLLNLAGQLSSAGRLVMSIDGTGGLLNFSNSMHDGLTQHLLLNVQLTECLLDNENASKFAKNLTKVFTVAERVGSSNKASDVEKWLTQVRKDTVVAMNSYSGSGYGFDMRPLIIKMDCALQLLSGCLRAFRGDNHVYTAAGYNSIVIVVMLWKEGMISVGSSTSIKDLAEQAIRTIRRGSPCLFKQCKVHVAKAIKSWPTTVKNKPTNLKLRKNEFNHMFEWMSNHLVNVGSISELIVRICVLITIFNTEEIPCERIDQKSGLDDGNVSIQLQEIAERMDVVMREEVRRIQIDSNEEMNKRVAAAFEKHTQHEEELFDGNVLARETLDRMMGRDEDHTSMIFSVTYPKKIDKKKKKGKLKVLYVVSPYSINDDGEEFIYPTLIGGGTVDISLPHRKKTVANPMYCPPAADYLLDFWLNRSGLWGQATLQTTNDAADANIYPCNNSCEGAISGMKNRVSTVSEDHSSIADLIHRRFEHNESMGRLLSNQIDGVYAKVNRRRDRATVTNIPRSNESLGETNMEWKRSTGAVRGHLQHYKDIMMRGLELGRAKGNFEYNKDKVTTMFDVLKKHSISIRRDFMSPTVFRIWIRHNKRLVPLRKDWIDIINSFYDENS